MRITRPPAAAIPCSRRRAFRAPSSSSSRHPTRRHLHEHMRRPPTGCSTRRGSITKWSCPSMPTRSITQDGRTWRIYPSGRVTQMDRDEFALLFVSGTGDDREVRVTRYSPNGTRSREQALSELSDAELARLFEQSQSSEMSPEAGYIS